LNWNRDNFSEQILFFTVNVLVMDLMKKNWRIGLLAILHLVGVIGLMTAQYRELTASLTPFNLMISGIIIFSEDWKWKLEFILPLVMIFLAGLMVEIIGVQTGWPFGDYYYGDNLGIKVLGTPILIGLNWLILVYTCSALMGSFFRNGWLKVLLAALLMLFIDIPLEPVAAKMDMWYWINGGAGSMNYIAWFIIAIVMLVGFNQMVNIHVNRTTRFYPILILIFFTTLLAV